MKHLFLLTIILMTAALAFAEDKVVEETDFTQTKDWKEVWNFFDSNYYRPYGEVSNDAKGMKVTTNGKRENLVHSNQVIDVTPGEEFDVVATLSSDSKTVVFFGMLEFLDGVFVKNDLAYASVDGQSQEVKTRIIAKSNGKSFNKGRIAFGVPKGKEVTVKRIQVTRRPPDDNKAVAALPKGIRHHFDASKTGSIVVKNGVVTEWKDRSGKGTSLLPATPDSAPTLIADNMNHRAVVRFDGKKKQELKSKLPLSLLDGITVFVVFKRDDAQGGGETWQDALYWGNGKRPDNTGFAHLDLGASSNAEPPKVYSRSSRGDVINKLTVGSNASQRGFVSGDIAEILVYERELTSQEADRISTYLRTKWNFVEDDYLRMGPISEPIKRITDKAPLSDQQNTGKWMLDESLSDEFNGPELDRTKWVDQVFYSLGDHPSRNLPDNVVFKDGTVNLIAKYDPTFVGGRIKPRGPEYHSFTVGSLFSRNHLRYGYLEIRAKVHKSAFSSTFWLIGGGVRKSDGWESSPEIDIFELAGKSFAHTTSYCMAVHDAVRKGTPMPAKGRIWKSNFNFTDDYHVYGLEWNPKYIAWYVDGQLVRKLTHTKPGDNRWDIGMNINISTETQFGWFGIPETADLPSTYSIDYLRVWKNKETTMADDWKQKYDNRHVMHDKGFAFDYYKKYGTKFVPGDQTDDSQYGSVSMGVINLEKAAQWTSKAGAVISADKKLGGIKLEFPATVSRKDNGEVQYAAAGGNWPEAMSDQIGMNQWNDYQYLAVDYHNPGPDVQSIDLIYLTESGKRVSHELVMKIGDGIAYGKIETKEKISKIGFGIRGSAKKRTVIIKNIRLQK